MSRDGDRECASRPQPTPLLSLLYIEEREKGGVGKEIE